MTQTRLKPQDQRLVYSGISWEEFKSIEPTFAAIIAGVSAIGKIGIWCELVRSPVRADSPRLDGR